MKEEAHETERGKGGAPQTKEGKGGGAMVVYPKVKAISKTVEEETSEVKKISGRSIEGELLMEKEVAKEMAKERAKEK